MKVCFVGDNRVRPNYGCRATSMAISDIVAKNHEIASVIYGDVTEMFRPALYKGTCKVSKLTEYVQRINRKFRSIKDNADFITDDVNRSWESFMRIYKKYVPLQELYDTISKVDAIILNGEGTFIFRQDARYDMNFYLFVLALAQSLGKKTYVLNAMFSDGSASQRNIHSISQTKLILQKCTAVVARDGLSYEYYKTFIGDNVEYIPDALFSWTKYTNYISLATMYPHAGIVFPDFANQWLDFDFSRPYVAVSAASREQYVSDDVYIGQYVKLVNALKLKYNVVIVQTCGGEDFLKEVARQTKTKIISNQTNILFGMSVLANAQCYVSGRWHPSILASLGGTPCVMLSSNSHKSAAIYRELKYNEADSHVYPNPPSDEDIRLIVEKVDYSIKNISRDKIREVALQNSALLHQYEQLLK